MTHHTPQAHRCTHTYTCLRKPTCSGTEAQTLRDMQPQHTNTDTHTQAPRRTHTPRHRDMQRYTACSHAYNYTHAHTRHILTRTWTQRNTDIQHTRIHAPRHTLTHLDTGTHTPTHVSVATHTQPRSPEAHRHAHTASPVCHREERAFCSAATQT